MRRPNEDKLAVGLQRLGAEDPTLRIEQNPETHQIVLWCHGEAHAGVVLDGLAKRYGVSVDTVTCESRCGRRSVVPPRVTAGTSSSPAPRPVRPSATSRWHRCRKGPDSKFVDKVVGGAVPRQFIPSVEKGVRAQNGQGGRCRLPDGRHPGHAARRKVAQRRLVGLSRSSPAWRGWRLRESRRGNDLEPARAVDAVSVLIPTLWSAP